MAGEVHWGRRDTNDTWDPRSGYVLQSIVIPNLFLGAWGPDLTFLVSRTNALAGWQIFPQGGRYFIRNLQLGPKLQLGLKLDAWNVSALYETSGTIGQQWSISPVPQGWQLTNGLLGNSSKLSVLSLNDKSHLRMVPVLAGGPGTIWNITRNPRWATIQFAMIDEICKG